MLDGVSPVGWVGHRLCAKQGSKMVSLTMSENTRGFLQAMLSARGYYVPRLLPTGSLAEALDFSAEYELA